MAKLRLFKEMISNFASVVDFVLVYVREAHPTDGWHVRGTKFAHLSQHKSLEERIEAASLLQQEDVKCPILVDTMDNKCSLAYGAFPERYYIIHNGKIVLFNGLGPEFYDPSKVKLWVESYMKSS